jgi:hypothetical protein
LFWSVPYFKVVLDCAFVDHAITAWSSNTDSITGPLTIFTAAFASCSAKTGNAGAITIARNNTPLASLIIHLIPKELRIVIGLDADAK